MVRWISFFVFFIIQSSSVLSQNYSIILGRPTNKSVTLSILFDQQADYYISYGTRSGSYEKTSINFTAKANVPDEIELSDLTINTRYYYRIHFKSGSISSFKVSPEYSFHTQRAPGSTFSFTVESDEHLYDKKGIRSMYAITLNNQALDKPDFMFSLGDIFGDDHEPFTITSAELDLLHKDYRPYLGAICHSIPFFISLGNHEGENDFYLAKNPPNNLAIWGTYWRKYYYPNPAPNDFYSGNMDKEPYGIDSPENYYAWTWGDALFVVLDAYRYQSPTSDKPGNWDWTLGSKQYNWLRSTLEKSQAKFKFVFAHHLRGQGRGGIIPARYFEWGGYEADGKTWGFDKNRPGWGKPIHQLFKDNGVNIFFQGHDHLFAHEVMDGVHYQEVPMPSDSTYMIGKLANADAYTSDTLDGTGHVRVTVSPSCVKVDYVKAYLPKDTLVSSRKNGQVAFSYSIGSCLVTAVNEMNNPYTGSLVKVYPNPSRDRIFLQPDPSVSKHETQIINSNGEIVMVSTSKEIVVSHLSAGMYTLIIKTNKGYSNKQIIIGR